MTPGQSERELTAAARAFQRGDVDYAEQIEAAPPPPVEAEPMVMRGVRLPVELDRRVRAAADRAGIPFSTLIREWIELGLTESEEDRTIGLAALRRAIAHATQSTRAA